MTYLLGEAGCEVYIKSYRSKMTTRRTGPQLENNWNIVQHASNCKHNMLLYSYLHPVFNLWIFVCKYACTCFILLCFGTYLPCQWNHLNVLMKLRCMTRRKKSWGWSSISVTCFFFPSFQLSASCHCCPSICPGHNGLWQSRAGPQGKTNTGGYTLPLPSRHITHTGVCHPVGLPRAPRHILSVHKYPGKTSCPTPKHDPEIKVRWNKNRGRLY